MLPREEIERREKKILAPYAVLSASSLGRKYHEDECPFRACFYRDLGRIVHSTAFRLLEYKTQVFVNHEGDYYRTRLTHSLEVSQISVGLARILKVNEDLAQTIALAHDLGHAPFGHPGEEVLNNLMKQDGGFEHNTQGYRVVTELEERYPHFPGLNLSYEVLEGMLKHHTDYDMPPEIKDFQFVGHPAIEAQIVNCADQIAFMNHDLDDGIHWGMLTLNSLKEVELWDETFLDVCREFPDAPERIQRCRTISNLIGRLISDIQGETKKRIKDAGIKTLDDVRQKGKNIVSFSEVMQKKTLEANKFLYKNVYHHPKVVEMRKDAGKIIEGLFNAYLQKPAILPDKYSRRFTATGSKRVICDYIAGMTDRFAMAQYKKIGF